MVDKDTYDEVSLEEDDDRGVVHEVCAEEVDAR